MEVGIRAAMGRSLRRTCHKTLVARALSTTSFRTVDPAFHAEPTQGEDAEEAAKSAAAAAEQQEDDEKKKKTEPPLKIDEMTIKSPPIASSPKLQHPKISPPNPTPIHQNRRIFSEAPPCIGFTGGGEEESKEEQEKEYKEYYKDHKASPLSEIEIAETRKPITRATDGSAEDVFEDVEPKMEEDTVDAALERAERMFREAADRGDPDLPHSRALARLRALRKLDDFPFEY